MSKGKKHDAPRGPQYSLDTAVAICTLVSDGLTLKDVVAMDGMPGKTTMFKWLAEHEEFANLYARAREERADLVADEIIGIADTAADPNKARVQIDARKWWAARVNPKKYGDKLQTESTSVSYVISASPMSPDEWEAKHCLEAAGRPPDVTH